MSRHQIELTLRTNMEDARAVCSAAANHVCAANKWRVAEDTASQIVCREPKGWSYNPATIRIELRQESRQRTRIAIVGSNLGLGSIQHKHVEEQTDKVLKAIEAFGHVYVARAPETSTRLAHAPPKNRQISREMSPEVMRFLVDIKNGKKSPPRLMLAGVPIILRSGEEALVAVSGVSLSEPRAVAETFGLFGGPMFEIGDGVGFEFGGFGSITQFNDQMTRVDIGTLVVTNRRVVFTGAKHASETHLSSILSIQPFVDGLALKTSDKVGVRCFGDIAPHRIQFQIDAGSHEDLFDGIWLGYIIEGLVRNSE